MKKVKPLTKNGIRNRFYVVLAFTILSIAGSIYFEMYILLRILIPILLIVYSHLLGSYEAYRKINTFKRR